MIRSAPLLLATLGLTVSLPGATLDFRVEPGSLEALWESAKAMAGVSAQDLAASLPWIHGAKQTPLPFGAATRNPGLDAPFALLFLSLENSDAFAPWRHAPADSQPHRTYLDQSSATTNLPQPNHRSGAPAAIALHDATGFSQSAVLAGRQGRFPRWTDFDPPEPEYSRRDPSSALGNGRDPAIDPCLTPVPEPASLGLALGAVALLALRRLRENGEKSRS